MRPKDIISSSETANKYLRSGGWGSINISSGAVIYDSYYDEDTQLLYIGGNFKITDNQGAFLARNFAIIDTRTNTVLEDSKKVAASEDIRAIHRKGDTIYVGGNFEVFGQMSSTLGVFDEGDLSKSLISIDLSASSGSVEIEDVEPDGSGGLYIAGRFTTVNGLNRNNVAHINSSGYVTDWNPNANGNVISILKYGDNVYLGGYFTAMSGKYAKTFSMVNTSGHADITFPNMHTNSGQPNVVSILKNDNTIYAIGNIAIAFSDQGLTFRSISNNLSKSFFENMGLEGQYWYSQPYVRCSTPDGQGGLYIGGDFRAVNGVTRFCAAHINSEGSITDWNPSASSIVTSMVKINDNIYFSGSFTSVNGQTRNYLAAVNTNGDLLAWDPSASGSVWGMLDVGDNIYIGGSFTTVGGQTRRYLAAVNTNGNLLAWNPSASSTVLAMSTIESNIYVGGFFSSVSGQTRNRLAAVNTNGNLLAWNPSASGDVLAVETVGDNIYVGGSFVSVSALSRTYFAVINSAGSVQIPSISMYLGSCTRHISAFSDTLFVGGSIYTDTVQVGPIVPMSPDGTPSDPSLNVNVSNSIYSAVIAGDNIYFSGVFTSVNGQPRNFLAAVNTNGDLLAWSPNIDRGFTTARTYLASVGDNIYIAGGYFNSVSGSAREGLAAVNTNGDLLSWGENIFGNSGGRGIFVTALEGNLYVAWEKNDDAQNIYAIVGTDENVISLSEMTQESSWKYTNYAPKMDKEGSRIYAWVERETPAYGGERSRLISSFDISSLSASPLSAFEGSESYYPVFDITSKGDNVYVSGAFRTPRLNFLALSDNTKALLAHDPSLFGDTYSISTTSDGDIYAAGSIQRKNVKTSMAAVVDTNNFSVIEPYFTSVLGLLVSAAPDGSGGYYIGGEYPSINGVERQNLAHINSSGQVTPWAPTVNRGTDSTPARHMTKFGDNIYLGGSFDNISGVTRQGFGAVDVSGNVLDFNPMNVINYTSATVSPYMLNVMDNVLYLSGGFKTNVARGIALFDLDQNSQLISTPDPLKYLSGSILDALKIGDNIYFAGGFQYLDDKTSKLAVYVDGNSEDQRAEITLGGSIYSQNSVSTILPDGSGGYYIGGNFTNINGEERFNLAHLNSSHQVTAWNPSANANVLSMLKIGDNIYMSGTFFSINGQTRNYLAAVNTNGDLLAWNPSSSFMPCSLASIGDNIYIGGSFTTVGGQTRRYLAAVNTNGNLLAWNPSSGSTVSSLVTIGNNIYIGGSFTALGGQTRRYLAAVNTNGNLLAWNPSASGAVSSFASLGDNIYMGGSSFTSVSGTTRNRLAAVNTNGNLLAWDPNANSTVFSLATDAINNRIYVVGSFTSLLGAASSNVVALDTSGALVTGFSLIPRLYSPGARFVTTSGANVYFGGSFASLHSQSASNQRNYLLAINTNGDLLPWNPSASSTVVSLASIGDNIYLGGYFDSVGGQAVGPLAAVNTEGNVLAWNPNSSNWFGSVAAFGSNIYAMGTFSGVTGVASINSSGDVINVLFSNSIDFYGRLITDQTQNSIVFLGGGVAIGGEQSSSIVLMNSSGHLQTLDVNVNGTINALSISDNVVYIGGSFTEVNQNSRGGIAALNTSGSLTPWNPNTNGSVFDIEVDGQKVYFAGNFTEVSGCSASYIGVFSDNTFSAIDENVPSSVNSIVSSNNVVIFNSHDDSPLGIVVRKSDSKKMN